MALKGVYRYLTKAMLIEANKASEREHRNQGLKDEFVNNLPDDKIYPVVFELPHNGVEEMRLQFMFNEKGETALIDVSRRRYDTLPTVELTDEGPVLKPPAGDRPYPEGREWVEKKVRLAVRDPKFRKMVLAAYGNQCAVCSINVRSLLRAAHIVPAVAMGDDSVTNGICLCVNHEVAFDRGILRIAPDGAVSVLDGHDVKVECAKLRLPTDPKYHPSADRLQERLLMLEAKDRKKQEKKSRQSASKRALDR